MVGNYMNAGSKNEQTIGFEMAFLTKVGCVKCGIIRQNNRSRNIFINN